MPWISPITARTAARRPRSISIGFPSTLNSAQSSNAAQMGRFDGVLPFFGLVDPRRDIPAQRHRLAALRVVGEQQQPVQRLKGGTQFADFGAQFGGLSP